MDPADLHLARIAQQLALAALQAMGAYNQAQNQLDLGRVLDADRLTSRAGTAESRRTVSELAALTARHKEMFSAFITGATSQLLAAAEHVAESSRAGFIEGLKASIDRNLAAQGRFYQARERWIDAATQALDLADAHPDDVWIEDGGLVFASTELLERFQALVERMDAVREEEVALMQERQAHLDEALARMNGRG